MRSRLLGVPKVPRLLQCVFEINLHPRDETAMLLGQYAAITTAQNWLRKQRTQPINDGPYNPKIYTAAS